MKAIVLGGGRMGSAISWAMKELGFDVLAIDVSKKALMKLQHKALVRTKKINTIAEIFQTILDEASTSEGVDVVISSLPYHQTEEVGLWCIDNNMRYCDLGGRVDVSANINEYANRIDAEYCKAIKPLFTDLGLAPGWVNILVEQGCKEIHRTAEEVEMMVGGIPGIPSNPPLNYAVTWSTDGLINEYVDDCEVLYDGEIKSVSGMDGLETVHLDLIDEDMEAFFTSGGASHTIKNMKDRGVKNCFYKTLRWPGHCQAVKFLIKTCDLSNDCLMEIFEKGCVNDGGDIVLIRALVKSGSITWKKEKIIPSDPSTGFSAMQRSTAFPISSIAKIMAEGYFDDREEERRGYYKRLPRILTYKDVPFDKFNENLKTLGIQ